MNLTRRLAQVLGNLRLWIWGGTMEVCHGQEKILSCATETYCIGTVLNLVGMVGSTYRVLDLVRVVGNAAQLVTQLHIHAFWIPSDQHAGLTLCLQHQWHRINWQKFLAGVLLGKTGAPFTQDVEHLATGVRKFWNTLRSMGVFTQLARNIKGFVWKCARKCASASCVKWALRNLCDAWKGVPGGYLQLLTSYNSTWSVSRCVKPTMWIRCWWIF